MITILITVGALPPERRTPVLAALRRNIHNPLVKEIRVVTEAASAESMAWLYEEAGSKSTQLHLLYVHARPTFTEMIRVGNQLLSDGGDTVALMNADISIASESDAERMLAALNTLDGRNAPVLLALTRHEATADRQWLGLYEPSGLPNTISADAWVFQKPLKLERDLFYMPGQMNCDMMLAYDLLSMGHRLFNPCFDVAIIHHEPEKEQAYYEEKNEDSQVLQETIWRHAKQNKVAPWNYYGTPWISSAWLKLGYRPAANSTHGRKVILSLPEKVEHRLGELLPELDKLVRQYGLEIQILAEGNLDRLIRSHAAELAQQPRIWFARSQSGLDGTRRAFLSGNQYGSERVAFVSDISRIDQTLLSAADCVFLTVQDQAVLAPPRFGCTLVTSVFGSDAFIRGFVRNITKLLGYCSLIEHVFLISKLSEIEIEVLAKLQTSYPNVVLLWHRTDPGLYECWNIGIRVARTEYISNANVDDLRHPEHVTTLVRQLEADPNVVVCATALVPFYEYPEDGSLPSVTEVWYSDRGGEFQFLDLAYLEDSVTLRLRPNNLPHCMPVWRRSLHERYGWFDEASFGTYADWAFWLKVLEDGDRGWLDRNPMSFYFVNPTSHNRRGENLDLLHRAVENAFAPSFMKRLAGSPPRGKPTSDATPRKLHLLGLEHSYGQHRVSFNTLVEALEPLNKGPGGIIFIPFLERKFVWGTSAADGEAGSKEPRPITEPWIGILHVPFDTPDWFENTVNPRHFFSTSLFQDSLPFCRGLITLSDDLRKDLNRVLPELPTFSLKFPTTLDVRMWEPEAYVASPCVVQVGDWLRKLQSIHRLSAPGHRRVMLMKAHTEEFLRREIEVFGDQRDPGVEVLELVPNEEYDAFLAQSVVLCLMYSTAANNIVIECIARATPIIVNPLPGAVEYLGKNYPLYAQDETEACAKLLDKDAVFLAHKYLLHRRAEIDLSYEGFCEKFARSEFYKTL